ncbi:MAG: S-layer homology domain-containing protein [Microcoleaceae cyanobacterium]
MAKNLFSILLTSALLNPYSSPSLAIGGWVETTKPNVLAQGESPFSDIAGHWAESCILDLEQQGIVDGDYEDNTFRPNAEVNRSELAIFLSRAFPTADKIREPERFVDIPSNYWARSAIQDAYEKGFISSYILGVFNPTIVVSRLQALTALTQGLESQGLGENLEDLTAEVLPTLLDDVSHLSADQQEIVVKGIANQLVVNYPDLRQFRPGAPASRAEVAALICQAVIQTQETAAISPEYVVRFDSAQTPEPLAEQTPETIPKIESSSQADSNQADPKPLDASDQEISQETELQEAALDPSPENTNSQSNPLDSEELDVETEDVETENATENETENRAEPYQVAKAVITETVEAELFLRSRAEFRHNREVRLRITREGVVRFDQVVLLVPRSGQVSANLLELRVEDLDNDQEPEVILDLQVPNLQTAEQQDQPFDYALIYRYNLIQQKYVPFE